MNKLKCVSNEFHIWEMKKFFANNICSFFIDKYEQEIMKKFSKNSNCNLIFGNDLEKNIEDRNIKRIDFVSDEVAKIIWNGLDFSVLSKIDFKPTNINSRFRIYKYFIEDEFKNHTDASTIISKTEETLYSLLIYLNDDFEGGHTKFNNFVIKPKTGTLVTFPHKQIHSGEKIISGNKYILRGDIIFKKTI